MFHIVKSAPPTGLGNNNNLALCSLAELRLSRYEYAQRVRPSKSNSNIALRKRKLSDEFYPNHLKTEMVYRSCLEIPTLSIQRAIGHYNTDIQIPTLVGSVLENRKKNLLYFVIITIAS